MSGFVHSQKVPKIYKAAATLASLVQEKGASIKELVFSNKYRHFNTKALYALIVETIQHEKILDELIRESKILAEGRLSPWLARVLITELLWGKKSLPENDCKPIQTVLEFHHSFLASLRDGITKGTHQNEERCNKALSKPRYVRVNTLAMTVEDAVASFCRDGWVQGFPSADNNYPSYLDKLSTIAEDEFIQDVHVKEMFAFPPGTEFFLNELYLDGSLILQDKATGLAGFLLDPAPGSSVLDMCAAPGLKTTHLAAIMQNQGTLYAAEKDLKRYKTLCEFTAKHRANIVKPINTDASTLTAVECKDVEYVLVDPTCSGSGMTSRLVTKKDEAFDAPRLAKLAAFQLILLERAMTTFPAVKRVVYSTCSIYPEENEQVVEKILKLVNTNRDEPYWILADVLDKWTSRGSADYECGAKCVYANPDKDLTTGFFVAVFERTEAGKACGNVGGNAAGGRGKSSQRRHNRRVRMAQFGDERSVGQVAVDGETEEREDAGELQGDVSVGTDCSSVTQPETRVERGSQESAEGFPGGSDGSKVFGKSASRRMKKKKWLESDNQEMKSNLGEFAVLIAENVKVANKEEAINIGEKVSSSVIPVQSEEYAEIQSARDVENGCEGKQKKKKRHRTEEAEGSVNVLGSSEEVCEETSEEKSARRSKKKRERLEEQEPEIKEKHKKQKTEVKIEQNEEEESSEVRKKSKKHNQLIESVKVEVDTEEERVKHKKSKKKKKDKEGVESG